MGLAGALAAVLVAAPPASAILPPLQTIVEEYNEKNAFDADGKQLFQPLAYAGRWYEVASLKKGFAGEGQEDCHCTQGIYTPRMEQGIKLEVDTFCVHGGPNGRLSGIKGSVSCANPALLEVLPEFRSELGVAEGAVAYCSLTFDSLPFLPPESYEIIRTDYTSYALVRGAKDRSFVQVYSRTPNPGPEFLAAQRAVLAGLSYPVDEIVDTPQDCPEMSTQAMMAAMDAGMAGAQLMPASTPPARAMAGYDLGPLSTISEAPRSGIQFEGLRDPAQTFKNLLNLLGM